MAKNPFKFVNQALQIGFLIVDETPQRNKP